MPADKQHDRIMKRCILCGQEKAVLPETEEYERALRGEEFPFTCPDCDAKAQEELEVAGGTDDDPLKGN